MLKLYYEYSNLLQENDYRYALQDREEPELFHDSFDFDSVPVIRFNHRVVPMRFPDEIWITDTTFRDGQQARAPFTVEQIVELYKLLSKLGGENGIIRQSEMFVYTEKDRAAVEKCRDLGLKFPEITTWIRANEKDFDIVKNLGIKETGILVSCSDYHIYNKMGLTRKQALDKYLGIIKTALDHGVIPRCHLEDITRADFYGFVIPFVQELMELGKEAGIPIKIRMCDTLGYGVNYPGVSLPRSVPGLVYGLRFYAGVPSEQLEWHGHNDFYKVVVNSTTAWLYGAGAVSASILGIGERTGNCPIEAMVMEYAQLKGSTDGMDTRVITEIADYMKNKIGYDIPENTPFVGGNFNTTRAGIHADGLLKDEAIYSIFNTGKILGVPSKVMVSEHSGTAGIAHWINVTYSLKGENAVNKNSELVKAVKELVDAEYKNGRNTAMSDHELENMVAASKRFLGIN